jgi:hypothetical protein
MYRRVVCARPRRRSEDTDGGQAEDREPSRTLMASRPHEHGTLTRASGLRLQPATGLFAPHQEPLLLSATCDRGATPSLRLRQSRLGGSNPSDPKTLVPSRLSERPRSGLFLCRGGSRFPHRRIEASRGQAGPRRDPVNRREPRARHRVVQRGSDQAQLNRGRAQGQREPADGCEGEPEAGRGLHRSQTRHALHVR